MQWTLNFGILFNNDHGLSFSFLHQYDSLHANVLVCVSIALCRKALALLKYVRAL